MKTELDEEYEYQPSTSTTSESQGASESSPTSSAVSLNENGLSKQSLTIGITGNRPMRTCRLSKRPILNAASIEVLFGIKKNRTNEHFSSLFARQLKGSNLRTVEPTLIRTIDQQIICLQKEFSVLDNSMTTSGEVNGLQLELLQPLPTVEETIEEQSPEANVDTKLYQPSEWVYETPDKQRIKTMDELNFEYEPVTYIPAVLQEIKESNSNETSTSRKTVYVLNDNQRPPVDIRSAKTGQIVPIDLKYLRPECTLTTAIDNKPLLFLDVPVEDREDEENLFLHNENETSIHFNVNYDLNFRMNSRKKFNLNKLNNDALTWYEKHMKMLVTCRPVKVKQERRDFLRRKSLSFQNETPTKSGLKLRSKFRSFDPTLLSANITRNTHSAGNASTDSMENDFFLEQRKIFDNLKGADTRPGKFPKLHLQD